jgi:hypothetical protein
MTFCPETADLQAEEAVIGERVSRQIPDVREKYREFHRKALAKRTRVASKAAISGYLFTNFLDLDQGIFFVRSENARRLCGNFRLGYL